MASELGVQKVIHQLEEGGWARWVWVAVLAGAVIYVSYAWLFKESGFKGLNHPRAFEQAVIARELARGNGFTTRIIRPAELWLFQIQRQTLHGQPHPGYVSRAALADDPRAVFAAR